MDEFSPELVRWLARTDAKLSVDSRRYPGVFASISNGETVFVLDRDDEGWIAVSESSRGSEPKYRFRTPSIAVVERFLATRVGDEIREIAHVAGPLQSPISLDQLAPGAVLRNLSQGGRVGYEQLIIGEAVIGEFGYGPSDRIGHMDAVRASHYGPVPLSVIEESYLSPDGAPLFTLRS